MKLFNNIAKTAVAIAAMTSLAACSWNDTFEGIVGADYVPDPDRDQTTPEVVRDRIPVVVSFTDPLYDFFLPTKADNGLGAFDGWKTDKEKWMAAQFHLFAFRSVNYANGKAVDFSKADQSLPGINNDIVRINDQGILKFEDNGDTRFYDAVNPDYRYKFFTYFADSIGPEGAKRETVTNLTYGKSTVKGKVERVDGSQDIMVGFGYHTESEIDARLKTLVKNGYKNSSFTRMLATYRSALTYSNTSAKAGLHPVLHLKHVMTSFDVQVRGCRSTSMPKQQRFRNIVITDVSIEAPTGGELTIANEEWTGKTSFEEAYNARNVFKPDLNTKDFLNMPLKQQSYSAAQKEDHDFYIDAIRKHYANNPSLKWPWEDGAEDMWWHVNSEKYQQINKGHFLVPNSDSYQLKICFYYIDRLWDHETNLPTDYFNDNDNPLQVINSDGNPIFTAVYRIMPPTPPSFKQGTRYNVTVDVYGPDNIAINVKALEKWADGGQVNVDVEN